MEKYVLDAAEEGVKHGDVLGVTLGLNFFLNADTGTVIKEITE